jgi:hypothetical protein
MYRILRDAGNRSIKTIQFRYIVLGHCSLLVLDFASRQGYLPGTCPSIDVTQRSVNTNGPTPAAVARLSGRENRSQA